ncbi:MAG: NAD(P)-dependent oxidoreductase [Xanthomonadales bacterium]|nr:NAD(P)-dependent oxidoreductase [Gammaproteobacteria bacterium]MBT8053564.1 NAD(P)-dependent oxidoreductase [Gammaproteobacteria bacterium]NND57955.1 NAD(P)-dependent oxidoreductase [Xanthomonadales bacterium]NNK50879.1 NAD(P)-dependent oxidoreductase [Xanthomonadales bacterium]
MGTNLAGKTLLITGASRGIGKAMALKAARDGANIAVAAKTHQKHPVLPGTIHSTVEEIDAAGGHGLAIRLDVRDEASVENAVAETTGQFGGLDILVNNASAIMLSGTLELPVKRYDLMFDTNVRGTYLMSRAAVPHLLKAANPHVLNLAPPLNMNPKWFKDHVAYTIAKYGMSMCVLGMAQEFRGQGIAFNALWPRTVIATAALNMLGGRVNPDHCRTEEIMADAAHAILRQDSRLCTGNFFLDEDVLRGTGVTDFEKYAVKPGEPLLKDLFLDG